MHNPIDPELLRKLDEQEPDLRLSLSRLPHRSAPPALIKKLKRDYIGSPWRDTIRSWFARPMMWKPVGAFALAAILAGFWISHLKNAEEEFIDMEPLAAAHARYQAETLVPQGDMAGSNFGAQLAVYYGDEK